jgi:DNA-binding NarL/FixJ family response regulator
MMMLKTINRVMSSLEDTLLKPNKNNGSILLVDDHGLFRQSVHSLLAETFPQSRIMEAHDGEDALQLLRQGSYGIAILDISMPGMNGFELASHIRKLYPKTKVVMLTSYNEKEVLNHAKQVGAKGFIVKEDAANDLTDCIHCVSNGSTYVSKSMSRYAFQF